MNDYYECVRCRVQYERSTMQLVTVLKDGIKHKVLICKRCKQIWDEKIRRNNNGTM